MIYVLIIDMKHLTILLITLLIVTSCKQTQKIADAITNPTAKDIFERQFKNDSLFKQYEDHYLKTKNNRLFLNTPTVIYSKSDTSRLKILAYTLHLKQGERLKLQTDVPTDTLQLAMDLYKFINDSTLSKKAVASNTTESNDLAYNVPSDGSYKIVVLPYGTSSHNFSLKLITEPTLTFPVSGKDNKAIQSFWGATRSGGTRSHEGIDIFAKRGTPVIAATNGYITSTGNRGLGGKQVWQRDGLFGASLYYAHLDSIAVSQGNRVKTGDTLGYVGNTGNAKATSPHLHFGIYTSSGAIDPLPFVKVTENLEYSESDFLKFDDAETRSQKNELRSSPNVKAEKITDLKIKTPVDLLGKTQQWFHIRVNDSLEGFMHHSLLQN